MANPFGIEQVDVPGILGVYQGAQDRRVNQMLLQRKMAAEDRALQQQETISSIYKNIHAPTGQSGGGGQSAPTGGASPLAAPYAAPVAPPASFDRNMPVGSPLSPATFPDAAQPAVASTMKAPAPLTQEDHSWLTENAEGIQAMIGIDPQKGFELYAHLKSMDSDARARMADAQTAIAQLGAAVADLPYEQRRAVIEQHAGDLMRAHPGLTPDMIAQFNPTDQNLHVIVNEALGVKGLVDHAEKAATAAETARHNRATEVNASGNLAVRQGALGLARGREGRISAKGKGGGSGGGDVGGLSTADLIRMAGGQ